MPRFGLGFDSRYPLSRIVRNMDDLKERLTAGVRKILDEKYTGVEVDDGNIDDVLGKISQDVCEYLWKNGLPEDIIPVVEISIADDGYISIEIDRYPKEEDLN